MGNPFNPEAGATPAPVDPRDLALVERSAKIIWRAFPYFEWRYGPRGRAFGRSDAGYIVTLLELPDGVARQQIRWLIGVLAARGMPSLLIEVQLESLGRLWRRDRGDERFLGWAAELRDARVGALDRATFEECERLCRAASRGDARRRGVGTLIAGAVADRALGIGEHDDALLGWLASKVPDEPAWTAACAAARDLALGRCCVAEVAR